MPTMSADEAFQQAVTHHQAGRLREAEGLYRQVLVQNPAHADALYHLGILAGQAGQSAAAADLIRRAIAVNPREPGYHADLGLALNELGKLEETIAAYRTAVALRPEFVEAQFNLGMALRDTAQWAEAAAAFEKVVELRPELYESHDNLANAYQKLGRLDEAIAEYQRALALRPDHAEAHYNLGTLLADQLRFNEAAHAFSKAIDARPQFPQALSNLGMALVELGQPEQAAAACRAALKMAPNNAMTHNNLACALIALCEYPQAIETLNRALALSPTEAVIHKNIGNALRDSGRVDEAVEAFKQAVKLDPRSADLRFTLGVARLLQGNLKEGFAGFEERWKRKGAVIPNMPGSRWDGSPLAGRRILLHFDQGLGDTIQYIRFAKILQEGGGSVRLRCQPPLRRLLAGQPAIDQVVIEGEPLPELDVHCPIVSLPYTLGLTLETIPAEVPYLSADPALVEQWRLKLAGDPRPKVGLVWAGNPEHSNDRQRSMPLASLAPLAALKNVRFVSLQKGAAAAQAKAPPAGLDVLDWTDELSDFADTAALIENLDLVITVDTSVAHLAGAMGKPVWILLPFAPEWRWMLKRTDSPWYPTARLFRQPKLRDWVSVMRRVLEELNPRFNPPAGDDRN